MPAVPVLTRAVGLRSDKAGLNPRQEVRVRTVLALDFFSLLDLVLNHCKQIFATEKYLTSYKLRDCFSFPTL